MSELVVIADDQRAELEEYRKCMKQPVDEDRFYRAVEFCHLVLDGKSRNEAYSIAFGIDKKSARKFSSALHRAKWVQDLFRFIRPDDQSLYHGENKAIILKGMEIINNPEASNRDKVEAMKALNPYIKTQNQKEAQSADTQTGNDAISFMSQVVEAAKTLAQNGKMISNQGEIIDVPILD